MYAEILAFAGCAVATFAGHYFTVRSLKGNFEELKSRLAPIVHEVLPVAQAAAHKVCSFCGSTVAKFEELDGKVKCANCKAEGK